MATAVERGRVPRAVVVSIHQEAPRRAVAVARTRLAVAGIRRLAA